MLGRGLPGNTILGDDLADERVAQAYMAAYPCGHLHWINPFFLLAGPVEFAKVFKVRSLTCDLSPLDIRKLLETRAPMGWLNYMLTLPVQLLLSTKLS